MPVYTYVHMQQQQQTSERSEIGRNVADKQTDVASRDPCERKGDKSDQQATRNNPAPVILLQVTSDRHLCRPLVNLFQVGRSGAFSKPCSGQQDGF